MKGGWLGAAPEGLLPVLGVQVAVLGLPGRAGAAHVVPLGVVVPGPMVVHRLPEDGQALAELADGQVQQGCR